jgi:putative Mg2+ transporter-C (MgtC) family protein
MKIYLINQLWFLFKLILAGLCGAVIGYERKNHLKEAGIRTHMLVAIGSALVMIISRYGFDDMLLQTGLRADPSRIAAQIVSGIGFLGAGMIFTKKQSISGLTTAAGIWTTAGIGMAISTNMYFVAIAATGMVFTVQTVLHKNLKWLKIPELKQIRLQFDGTGDCFTYVCGIIKEQNMEIIELKASKTEAGLIEIQITMKTARDSEAFQLLELFCASPGIRTIEL